MSENKGGPLYGIGGVTLLTVLLVLCLTLFAVLALSSAQADLRLSEKNARTVTAYYTAEGKAYDLMRVAGELWPAGIRQPSADEFARGLPTELSANAERDGEAILVSVDIPVQDDSFLRVAFSLRDGADASRWEIRQWQLLPPPQDEADIAFLPVWIPSF